MTAVTHAEPGAVDCVLLDVDGTLIDSTYLHALAWQRAFARHQLDVPWWETHFAIGMGFLIGRYPHALLFPSVQVLEVFPFASRHSRCDGSTTGCNIRTQRPVVLGYDDVS